MGLTGVSIGQLRERVTIQRQTAVRDGLGHSARTWSDVFVNLWARVTPIRAREIFAAGQHQPEGTVSVVVRFRDGITSDMRVMWRGQPHAIVGNPIDIQARREYLELLCESGVRDGR